MTPRTFPVAAVLSVYHNRMLCPFADYRDLLNYMTRTTVPLWEVSRARILVAHKLIEALPELGTIKPIEKTDAGNANKYVQAVIAKVGYHEVELKPLRARMKIRKGTEALKFTSSL